MSEKMMDEFEVVFPMPNHVMHCGKGYVATEYSDWRANDYCQKWIGWQASRAALVVELPDEYKDRYLDKYQEGFNDAVESCRNRLEDLGLELE